MHDLICGKIWGLCLSETPSAESLDPLCSSLLPLWMRRCSLRWCLYLKAFPHWLHLNFRLSRPGSDVEFWKTRAVMSMLCFCMCVVSYARTRLMSAPGCGGSGVAPSERGTVYWIHTEDKRCLLHPGPDRTSCVPAETRRAGASRGLGLHRLHREIPVTFCFGIHL